MKQEKPDSGPMTGPASTVDTSEFKSNFLLRLLSSPWTLGPLLAGITTLLAVWTFNIKSGLAVFAGLLAIVGAIGIFFTRLFLGSKEVGKETIQAMKEKALADRAKKLDDLDERLSDDGDQRTEQSLRDLRTLARAFHGEELWPKTFNPRSIFDVLKGVEQLFNRCVQLLEKSLSLWYTASDMATEDAREPILEQRERIIEDVSKGIKQLGRILAEVQTLGAGESAEDALLGHIREELDASLEVAKRVEERMRSIDRDLDRGIS